MLSVTTLVVGSRAHAYCQYYQCVHQVLLAEWKKLSLLMSKIKQACEQTNKDKRVAFL